MARARSLLQRLALEPALAGPASSVLGACSADPASAALYRGMSPHARTILDTHAAVAGVAPPPAGALAAYARRLISVDLLDLGPIAGQRAGTLSRGQAQRVSLARALVAYPPILLLDEPLSGVDPGVGVQLSDHLRALADDGQTLVVSTHELAEASGIGDDVTVLRAGRVVGQGATAALRTALAGEGYRLRLRATGDLPGVLSGLGYHGEPSQGGGVIVEVPDEKAVESLVAGLVSAGIGVHEVAPADNPLEDLYLHLQETTPSAPDEARPARMRSVDAR